MKAKATRETQKVREVAFINERLTDIDKLEVKAKDQVVEARLQLQLKAQQAKIRDQVWGRRIDTGRIDTGRTLCRLKNIMVLTGY